MLKYLLPALLILTALASAPAAAQEQALNGPICRSAGLTFTPARQQLADVGAKEETEKEKAEREEKERLDACKRAALPDPTKFSYYGYQHALAHCKNWVKQLQDSTGYSCCSSAYTGECRVTKYDRLTNSVEIDGVMCPVTNGTHWGLTSVSPGLVLACAPKLGFTGDGKPSCPVVHCIGRGLGA